MYKVNMQYNPSAPRMALRRVTPRDEGYGSITGARHISGEKRG